MGKAAGADEVGDEGDDALRDEDVHDDFLL